MKKVFLSGGGVKGLIYIGVLSQFYNKKLEFDEYHGVSIGSLFCLYHILNIKPIDILKDFHNIKIKLTLDAFFEKNHLFKENPITKLIPTDLTFKEFYNQTKKTFHVYSTNFDTSEQMIFNYMLTPNVLIKDAILASCCLPILFPIVKINNQEYVDGIFSLKEYPDCDLIFVLNTIKKNSDVFFKTFHLAIPKKKLNPKIILLNTDSSSLDFQRIKDPKFISTLISIGVFSSF